MSRVMQYQRCFKFILCLLFFCPVKNLMAVNSQENCGEYTFIVTAMYSYETQYRLLFQKKQQKPQLFYNSGKDVIINTKCVQNSEQKFLMLFQEISLINKDPNGIIGLFDPESEQLLADPKDFKEDNSPLIAKILGTQTAEGRYDTEYFCCQRWD